MSGEKLPKSFTEMIGNEYTFKGGLFSSKRQIEPTKMKVLKVRWSSAIIVDMKTMQDKHPAIELLVKNESMKRARWTRPFPVREVQL